MRKIVIIVILVFMLCGCNNTSGKLDINKLMQENEYIVIDVRSKEEYADSHVVGAINIPYDQINEDSNLDKDKIIFVYCMSGARSEIAFDNLSNLGYTVYDLGAFSKVDLPKE